VAKQDPAAVRQRHDIDSLADISLEVFRARGYDATSMEHLAAAAGVSKAAFYHHMTSKEDLLACGFERALDALFALLDEPASREGPALNRFRHVLRRVVELEHDLLAEVTVLLRTRGNSPTERAALDRRRQFDRRVADLIEVAQREGSLRTDIDPHLAARLAIGTATSIVEWYRPGGKLPATRLADQIVAMTCSGLATHPAKSPAVTGQPRTSVRKR
jgi:AcrR family transcriptional regulator